MEPSTVTISTANKSSEAMLGLVRDVLITINGVTIPETLHVIAEC
jgi:hypothetical protein